MVAIMMFPVFVTIYFQSGGNVPQALFNLSINMNMARRMPFNFVSVVSATLLTMGYAACLYPTDEMSLAFKEHYISHHYVISILRNSYQLFFLLVLVPECTGRLVLAVHYQIPLSQMQPSFISWDMWLPIVSFMLVALLAANLCVLLACSRRVKGLLQMDLIPVVPFVVYYIVYAIWQFIAASSKTDPINQIIWPIMMFLTITVYIATIFAVNHKSKWFRFRIIEN